ncbi:MAG: DUF1552 domain-containing protein [Planctomycetes bacterium]|nr:DUF1552 domain-containing protein [Planctomycetota bacterium]
MPTRPLSRRSVLRGAGAALALPWLEAMRPGRREPAAPVRMAFVFVPNGVLPQTWTPADEGPEWTPSPTLQPLAPFRDRTLVLSGLFNRNSDEGEGHYVKTTALLSGARVHKTGGRDLRCGITVDQLAAAARGHLTPLPSLELGLEPVRHQVDMGYSTVYGATLSWRSPTQPATKEIHPRLAFDRLFRRARMGDDDRSVLDLVLADGRRLRDRLGGADRARLDEHLDSIRALEQRIDALATTTGAPRDAVLAGATPPPDDPAGFEQHLDLMLDVIALAFRSDTTRIVSLMLGNAVSGRDFSFLPGVRGSHHELSHHENDPQKQKQYALINRWHVTKLAALCERLDAAREGDATLLDSSMVFYGSGIRDGNRHDPHDLPIVLVGRAGGRLRSGAHLRFPRDTALTNLYVAMLAAFGCPVPSFSDSTGALDVLA